MTGDKFEQLAFGDLGGEPYLAGVSANISDGMGKRR